MQNELNKKFEEFNEQVLKNTAVTFSLEGFSKDLNNYVQKKITFNTRIIKYLSMTINSILECDDKEIKRSLLKSDSLPIKTLKHLYEEIEGTNGLLNFIIQKNIEQENSLIKDLSKEDKIRPKKSKNTN